MGGAGVNGRRPILTDGLNTLGLALIGEYVGRIYREVRGRPRFVVRQTLGPES